MLQIQKISKKYQTGDLIQTALDNVSLNLRDNEFVAILGPSGSGKTTLLNVIGGLDRYDTGDLIINGVSTKKYKDRDWDSYRNHTIGFVFQSYNLIPHQSILANVELALTISGVSRTERRKRAKEALAKVGLGEQIHKKPSQLSGGQMQRVAIARALINNPDILLADEPTGALDTETSVQVMELLKEVAKDRLVVMVTHNPELAESYATRTVKLRDGRILDDSNPYEIDSAKLSPPTHKNMGKSSMSLLTSLSLSFNNLKTKKGRTLLTSFAGSIGIIGIALILSLSTGVNDYITSIQKSTMLSYPISIEAQTIDISSLMTGSAANHMKKAELDHDKEAVYSNSRSIEMASSVTTSITQNNLTAFKKYLDDPDSEIYQYIGENGILYSYATKFGVYTYDPDSAFVDADGSTLSDAQSIGGAMISMDGMSGAGSMSAMMSGTGSSIFEELLPGNNGEAVSKAVTDSYDMVYGEWPESYDEVVLILDENNEIPLTVLYELGILPSSDYKELMKKIESGEAVSIESTSFRYEELCAQTLYMIPACDTYLEREDGTFRCVEDDKSEMEELMKSAVQLKITGIIRPAEDAQNDDLLGSVGYTKALTDYLIAYTDESAVVKAQRENPDVNILSGISFAPADDQGKIADTKTYLASLGISDKAKLCKDILQSMYAGNPDAASQMLTRSEAELAAALDAYMQNPEDDTLLMIYDTYISAGTYDDNMSAFGVVSTDAPASISIYADSFEDKDAISDCIKAYNTTASEEDQITYTDYVGLLMSSVTTIINVISYVLIAFVAVSLVVSSIMIGIITYISVLERTKEIGILRAIGASKRNISRVFNAETFIIGLCSGLIGIGITLLLLIPGNALIHALTGATDVNAVLPITGAVILVLLSMILTLIGGWIPSKKAARKDPVTALRTE